MQNVCLLQVQMKDTNDTTEVWTYRLNDDKMVPETEDCRPSPIYKKVILRGAVENKLPEDYIEKWARHGFPV